MLNRKVYIIFIFLFILTSTKMLAAEIKYIDSYTDILNEITGNLNSRLNVEQNKVKQSIKNINQKSFSIFGYNISQFARL